MSYDTARPYIASFVIFRKGDKLAFVLRRNTTWMDGYYGLPSGKVEKEESFLQAAVREAKEEAGVEVKPADLKPVLTMCRANFGDHAPYWIDQFFIADKWKGELKNAEPHKSDELAWLDANNLPENIVPPVRFALEQIELGKTYAEYGWNK